MNLFFCILYNLCYNRIEAIDMKYRIDNQEYSVEIIRKNNKNTYIRMKGDTIEVSTNYFVTKKQIVDILNRNATSLQKMLIQCQQRQEKQQKFMYLGVSYDIIIMPTEQVEIVDQNLYTSSREQLQAWYQNQMQQIYEKCYRNCYHRFEEKLPFYQLKIRKMKTRWGVCNRKSETITLNSELLHYDYRAIEYVVIHELSHLIHFNHSSEFWKVVAKYCPNYKEMKKILKE